MSPSMLSLTQHDRNTFTRLGAIEILSGVISIVYEASVLATQWQEEVKETYQEFAPGLWCGASFIISGAFCIIAKRKSLFSWMLISLVVAAIGIAFSAALLWLKVLAVQSTSSALHIVVAMTAVLFFLASSAQIYFGISSSCFMSSNTTKMSYRTSVSSVNTNSAARTRHTSQTALFVSRYDSNGSKNAKGKKKSRLVSSVSNDNPNQPLTSQSKNDSGALA